MRHTLLAGTAGALLASPVLAADLPVRKAPFAPAAVYDWTGFYIGGHLGGAWGDKDWFAVGVGPLGSHDVDGFIGGGQVGFNYQVGTWVFGVEADFSWADVNGHHVDNVFFGDNRTKVDWFGTVTGRIGYAFDRTLLYVKAGGAWARDVYTITATGFFAQTSDTNWGWTVGAGLEYGLTPNWSLKLEYNYLSFDTQRVTFVPNTGGPFDRDVDQQIHVLKAGINYRFGGPITARY